MKKLLLGLGAATSAIAPIVAVVACSDDDKATPIVTSKTVTSKVDTTALDQAGLESAFGGTVAHDVVLTADQVSKGQAYLGTELKGKSFTTIGDRYTDVKNVVLTAYVAASGQGNTAKAAVPAKLEFMISTVKADTIEGQKFVKITITLNSKTV